MRGAFFVVNGIRSRHPPGNHYWHGLEPSREQHLARTLITTMDEIQQPKGKILHGTEGLGTATREMIDQRAGEIARSDGRAEANDLDRTRAREDLTGSPSRSELPSTVGEPDSDWYTPLGSSGTKASTVRPEDEENIPDKLIQEGVEEADHDQRSKSGRTGERQK